MDPLYLIDSSDESDDERVAARAPKIYRPRINFEVQSDFQFKEKFRMRRWEVDNLVNLIGGNIVQPEINMSLSPSQQILIALHWMGNAGYYHGIADMHGISKSTVCRILKRVVYAIVDVVFHAAVKWPTNMDGVAEEFFRKGGFPSVCGCVDGTLVRIDAPTQNEGNYVDRHGDHSLNCMMICGPDYSFYAVSARWPGSVHDSRVFRNSPVYDRFEEGWRPFAGAVILGDSGYRRRNWLMTPYASNVGDAAEARFNRAHKRTRRLVENSFGILKERFPCLNKMRLNPEYTGRIVMACAALHNITTTEDFMVDGIAEENEDGIEIEPQLDNNQRLNELLSFFRQ